MVQYRKSALVAISFILLLSISLFLYSCGQNNPTGAGGNKQTVSNPSAVVAAGTYTQKAYISGMQVPVINLQTNTVLSTLTKILLGGEFAAGIATNNVTGKVYITGVLTSLVLVLNANTDTLANLPVTVGIKPTGIAVNPATNMIYVANSGSNNVSVISGANNAVVATVAVGTNPQRIAVDDRKNIIFVTNSMGNSISVIDGVTNTVSATIAITNPADVGVDSLIGQVYVSDRTNNRIAVLDSASNGIKTYINMPTGMIPGRIAVNHVTNQIYVSSIQQGVPISPIVVIDGVSNKIAGLIMPTTGTGSIAISESLNYLYTNQLNYAGDFTTRTIQGTSIITAINLGSIPPLTPPSASAPPAPVTIKPVATITASWSGTMGFNVYIADGDIAILDNAPAGTPQVITPPPPPPKTLTSLNIQPKTASVSAGAIYPFVVSGVYSDGSSGDLTTQATWSTGNPAIATASPSGIIMGIASGATSVTASYSGLSDSASISISAMKPDKIMIASTTNSIGVNGTASFTAKAYYGTNTIDITTNASITWKSSNMGVATINNMGIATGKAVGISNISATYDGLTSNTIPLTVAMPKLLRIDITPLDSHVAQFDIVPYTAKGTFGNAGQTTQRDITNEVVWSADNGNIAQPTITYTGPALNPTLSMYRFTPGAFIAIGNNGTAIITAASGTIVGTASMTIGCSRNYTHYRQNDNFPTNDPQYNSTYPQHLNNYWTDLPFANHTASETVPPRIKGGVLPASIGDVGCLMVSAAMALTATGTPVDPGQLNAYLNGVPKGYISREVNFDWIIAYAGSRITNVSTDWISTTVVNQTIITALSNCNPVILQVSGNDGYFATHFVLATAYKNNKIYIYDPWWRYKAGDTPIQLDELEKRYNITAYKILTVQ